MIYNVLETRNLNEKYLRMFELDGGFWTVQPIERINILGWEYHIQTCKREMNYRLA